jgi:squalene synthase HpnC
VVDLEAAYASCERDVRGHYENFPVASLLIPRGMRQHVAAVYAFARAADDFADEGQLAAEDRLRLLDGWQARLCLAADERDGSGDPPRPGEPANSREIFRALGHTIRVKALPCGLFEDLLSAFRQDVTVSRYETWATLLDYCRRSANPVGRLVLRIAGHRDERFDLWSDAICTALQLTNFWQDLAIDASRGRVYLPAEAHRATPVETMTAVIDRTRRLFHDGRPLCDAVHGRLRYELRATWLGGMRVLDRLAACAVGGVRIRGLSEVEGPDLSEVEGRDPRPTLGLTDIPWFAWHMLTWGNRTAAAHRGP